MTEDWKNKLYYGDNLKILRELPSESVDLIYLDPPFNSKANYNVLFREKNGTVPAAQVRAFKDFWHWVEAAETYHEMVTRGPKRVADLLQALRGFLGENDMLAYITMMAPRVVELRRILKPNGTIYLHCDPTASHYLKFLLDAIFGPTCFLNEIVWHYRKWATGKHTFQRNHDVIFLYSKSDSRHRVFNQLFMERAPSTLKRFGTARIISGYDENGRRLPSRTESEHSKGVRQDDVWDIGRVPPIKQLFPTEKPEPLLERIISASSNEGDIVLDPFCGCGTTVAVAERLKRRWIGIDITHLAIALMKHRLEDTFGDELSPYEINGVPEDLKSAEVLAQEDAYQFQYWALSLIDALPVGEQKKGADKGMDGYINFFDDKSGKPKKVVVQVKGGQHVGVGQIRDLEGVMRREDAVIGVFITLQEPTKPMKTEAAAVGFYEPEIYKGKQKFPKLQILTIEELLKGKQLQIPRLQLDTFKKAGLKGKSREQLRLTK